MRSRRSSPRSRTSLQPPRHGDHGDADERGHHREQRELHLAELEVAEQEHGDPAGDEHGAPATTRSTAAARPAQPGAGARGPAPALRLVGLPPHHGGADRGHAERPDDPADDGVAQRAPPPGRRAMPERREPEGLLALGARHVRGRRRRSPAGRRPTAARRRARPAPLTPASTTNAARTHRTRRRGGRRRRPRRPRRTGRCAAHQPAGSRRGGGAVAAVSRTHRHTRRAPGDIGEASGVIPGRPRWNRRRDAAERVASMNTTDVQRHAPGDVGDAARTAPRRPADRRRRRRRSPAATTSIRCSCGSGSWWPRSPASAPRSTSRAGSLLPDDARRPATARRRGPASGRSVVIGLGIAAAIGDRGRCSAAEAGHPAGCSRSRRCCSCCTAAGRDRGPAGTRRRRPAAAAAAAATRAACRW